MTPSMRELSNVRKGHKGAFCVDPVRRFFAKVEQPANSKACWRWLGGHADGYGALFVNGKRMKATRFSWEIHNRQPFPPGLYALHSCDNPWCVNPEHIRPGTAKENTADAVARGRLVKVMDNPKWRHGNPHKTHCLRGHELVFDGRYWRCKECLRMHRAAYQKRRDIARAALAPHDKGTDNG
jgi:hypothetical protein